jgi:cobalt-zinc-cadmium efflux system membrane fusion protein
MAKTKIEVAQANYEREKGLWEKKISSEKEMLDAKGEYFMAKAEFEAAESKLHLLGLSEDDIQSTISQLHSHEHFPLLSPYKGTVIEKHITLGEMTNPEETLFTIANLDILWIILDIYEKDLAKIVLGQDVEINVSTYPDNEFNGRITYISNVVEEDTRTVKVRVEIDNNKRILKPGMFATAKIVTGKPEEIFTVPLSAIQRLQDKEVVFVDRGKNFFECCTVKTGREFETDIEVLEGIKEGEKVVIEGAFYLKSELLKETISEGHAH